jgi:hypothetical protein
MCLPSYEKSGAMSSKLLQMLNPAIICLTEQRVVIDQLRLWGKCILRECRTVARAAMTVAYLGNKTVPTQQPFADQILLLLPPPATPHESPVKLISMRTRTRPPRTCMCHQMRLSSRRRGQVESLTPTISGLYCLWSCQLRGFHFEWKKIILVVTSGRIFAVKRSPNESTVAPISVEFPIQH